MISKDTVMLLCVDNVPVATHLKIMDCNFVGEGERCDQKLEEKGHFRLGTIIV
jgi:hypothetical protein